MQKFGLLSLGCPKNLVDSETFCYIAEKHGYRQAEEFVDLDFVLINTCSFITEAIDELERVLKEVVQNKRQGIVKRIFVTGCIMKRSLRAMQTAFPDVDAWIGIKDYKAFESLLSGTPLSAYHRVQLTDGPYAYLKISDGCNNQCSYCTIPSIRGKLEKRKIEDLVREATFLANTGAKELVVIAQDTSAYGVDSYKSTDLTRILKRLHEIPGFHWIRLMYLHPKHVTEKLIQTIAALPKMVHAFEMPLQHCNSAILQAMNRGYDKADIIRVYQMIKAAMPDAVFRTTFITGFPGETRKQFNELLDFIQQYPFLRLGAFAYSREAGTPAFGFAEQVTERTALRRKNELLTLHKTLSEQYLVAYLGKNIDVLIEEAYPGENDYYGRAWFDAPEIDGIVNFTGRSLGYGDLVKVQIDDVIDIDLFGRAVKVIQKYDFIDTED